MSAVISRESRASDVAVAQDMFTVSDGIIISSDIPSDMVNIFCRQLKKAEFRELKLDGDSCTKEINYVCLL